MMEYSKMKHEEIYASIYIRSLIAQEEEPSYYFKSIVTNLMAMEYNFALNNPETYKEIITTCKKVWNIVQKDKDDYMIQTTPLVSALYLNSKKQFIAVGIPKILFDRMMMKYLAIGDDKHEARSYNLAKEIFRVTQEVIDERGLYSG